LWFKYQWLAKKTETAGPRPTARRGDEGQAMSEPLRSSCCRRGYWSAIAYGAAVIWASYVVVVCFGNGTYYTYEIDSFLGNRLHLCYSLRLYGWLYFHWLGPKIPFSWELWAMKFPFDFFAMIFFAIAHAVQWVVFLGMLRLYWWTRRAPVTGWSALAAVFFMAAVITLTNHLYLWQPSPP